MTKLKTSPATSRHPQLITDGQEFKHLFKAAMIWLQHHQTVINSLNVYPVPDGDTGTNMVLTMQSAWAEIKDSPERNVGQIAHKMAHGALMGARGNSGVILSQIWRGFARSLDQKDVFNAQDLASAYQEATDTAYKGVVKPVEGTILTVVRAVADEMKRVARKQENLVIVMEQAVAAAREAVKLTPSLLPVLKEAGVVDAGGQGLYVILEGMLRHMHGETLMEDVDLTESVDLIDKPMEVKAGYGYDVQFLIVGERLDENAILQDISNMGECPLAVGDAQTVKVHVHVPDPGVPISYGANLGSLRDVVVEDMQAQYQDFIVESGRPPGHPPQPREEGMPSLGDDIGIVSVVMGEGLARVFKSLGVQAIVQGGQTMNPSTQDLLEAIEHTPAEHVIVLPNNSNVILAAEQAREMSPKDVAVIPSRSIPQGIAATFAINAQADFETNVGMMMDALEEVETGEITTATRSVKLNGLDIADGQIIGLHNGELKISGETITEVASALLDELIDDFSEIITLYYGEDVVEEEAHALSEVLAQKWPDGEIEVVEGGQPHYYYIVSVE